MNRISPLLLILFFYSLILACGPEQKTNPTPEQQPPSNDQPTSDNPVPPPSKASLSFSATTFAKHYGDCAEGEGSSGNCANIKLTYPLAKGKDSEIINKLIVDNLKSSLQTISDTPDKELTLEQKANIIFKEYQKFKKEGPDNNIEYHFESTGKVLLHNEKMVSVELNHYTYLGGAHPNAYTNLINIDRTSGKVLAQNDFIIDRTKLKKLGETAFFKAREGDGTSKSEYFWDGPYKLPENIALTKEGLFFCYNPYEVAAYVYGPTEYTIPYSELKGIINPAYLPQ